MSLVQLAETCTAASGGVDMHGRGQAPQLRWPVKEQQHHTLRLLLPNVLFCRVVSPEGTYTLQAESEYERAEWIAALQVGLAAPQTGICYVCSTARLGAHHGVGEAVASNGRRPPWLPTVGMYCCSAPGVCCLLFASMHLPLWPGALPPPLINSSGSVPFCMHCQLSCCAAACDLRAA